MTAGRNVRVPEDRWQQARAKAAAEGSDLAKYLNTWIELFNTGVLVLGDRGWTINSQPSPFQQGQQGVPLRQ